MSEWQPIESAPKDGTQILAFGDGLMAVVKWYDGFGRWEAAYISGWEWETELESPTHWMPLPHPPQDDPDPPYTMKALSQSKVQE